MAERLTRATGDARVRTLVADDAAVMRLLLEHLLAASGLFSVVATATTGQEAIAQAAAEQPDLILLDLAMPGMDGLAALPEIIARSPGSFIIVLSGFTTEGRAEQALGGGAHAYIEKNHHPDELLRQIIAAYRPAL